MHIMMFVYQLPKPVHTRTVSLLSSMNYWEQLRLQSDREWRSKSLAVPSIYATNLNRLNVRVSSFFEHAYSVAHHNVNVVKSYMK